MKPLSRVHNPEYFCISILPFSFPPRIKPQKLRTDMANSCKYMYLYPLQSYGNFKFFGGFGFFSPQLIVLFLFYKS